MRVLFDALGSPAESGGMRLHATQVVSTWRELYPGDDLHLMGPQWATDEQRFNAVTIHSWPNESVLTRAPGQLLATALVARRMGADAVISLSPIVTPFSGRPTIAFQHDWRHIKNPGEFGRAQRLYRQLWKHSARWAGVNACISQKTIDETLAVSPRARTALVPNGHDDARSWEHTATARIPGQIATFGHHNNKRPELLIRAMPMIPPAVRPTLIVLGATGQYRQSLSDLANDLGVSGSVSLPGFVERDEYEQIVSSSSLIALVSSDEGFGLPIAEAASLGIPALITSDSGISEIFGGYALEAAPTPEAIASAVASALSGATRPGPTLLRTWKDTVRELRTLAAGLARGVPLPR